MTSQLVRQKLLALCRTVVEGRIASAKEAIAMAQESANEESKNSAGDKYETGRAMAQLEIEKASSQLAEANKLRQALQQVPVDGMGPITQLGSLVITNKGNYFISIAAGSLSVDDKTWYAISTSSPLGSKLIGTKEGDVVRMQEKEIVVEKVA